MRIARTWEEGERRQKGGQKEVGGHQKQPHLHTRSAEDQVVMVVVFMMVMVLRVKVRYLYPLNIEYFIRKSNTLFYE